MKFFQTANEAMLAELVPLVEVGLNHEQQHQELMLTDILHAFGQNPIPPAYDSAWTFPKATSGRDEWVSLNEGIHSIGHAGDSFHFDNEKPAHRALVGPVKLARHLVTNAEWLAFMADGGYRTPTLWLMDGFAAVNNEEWQAPGHWRQIDGEWKLMTLGGLKPVDAAAPVSHVSYYEADAFARWSGKHLPTEMEWEVAARAGQLEDAFGIVWQWTRSSYSPYPGYRAVEGALGEYNGKFMINQLVLRGSSLATRKDIAASPIATSFIPTIAGNSTDCGSPIMSPDFCTQSRRDARPGEYYECPCQRPDRRASAGRADIHLCPRGPLETCRSDRNGCRRNNFYDATGSELFEASTRLPEYYPTRTELSILRDRGRKSRISFRREQR